MELEFKSISIYNRFPTLNFPKSLVAIFLGLLSQKAIDLSKKAKKTRKRKIAVGNGSKFCQKCAPQTYLMWPLWRVVKIAFV